MASHWTVNLNLTVGTGSSGIMASHWDSIFDLTVRYCRSDNGYPWTYLGLDCPVTGSSE